MRLHSGQLCLLLLVRWEVTAGQGLWVCVGALFGWEDNCWSSATLARFREHIAPVLLWE